MALSAGTTAAHHTDKYDLKGSAVEGFAVVRRGQPFSVDVTFKSGNVGAKTKLAVLEPDFVKITAQSAPDNNVISIVLSTDVTARVGKVDIVIGVASGTSKATLSTALLFNPFLQADTAVYMGDVPTAEYLENDYGRVYLGSINNYNTVPWYYGSQQGSTLATALYLIDTVRPSSSGRSGYPLDQSDARMVARHLTFALTDQR